MSLRQGKKVMILKVLEPCKAISNELRIAQQIIVSELEGPFESLLIQIPHFAHEKMDLPLLRLEREGRKKQFNSLLTVLNLSG